MQSQNDSPSDGSELYCTNHVTRDGEKIEILAYRANQPKASVLLIPCGLGNACSPRLYGVPKAAFLSRGYSIVLYNPRGHGASEGTFSLETSVQDILDWLGESKFHGDTSLPLICVGHSLGSIVGLALTRAFPDLRQLFLVSPVLESRLCPRYMYELGNHDVFIKWLETPANGERLREVLADSRWVDLRWWDEHGLDEYLAFPTYKSGRVFIESVAKCLKNIFVVGHNMYPELEAFKQRTTIFVAEKDIWFPLEKTFEAARRLNVPVVEIVTAQDHLLRDRWLVIWENILERLPAILGNTSSNKTQCG